MLCAAIYLYLYIHGTVLQISQIILLEKVRITFTDEMPVQLNNFGNFYKLFINLSMNS